VPDEPLDIRGIRAIWIMLYGLERWGDLFSPRQSLVLVTLSRLVREAGDRLKHRQNVPVERGKDGPRGSKVGGACEAADAGLAEAVTTCLSLTVGRQADILSSLARWHATRDIVNATFGRQALGLVWDFAEANFASGASGSYEGALEWVATLWRTASHVATSATPPASIPTVRDRPPLA
jgi:adenine-specific DNA methylase